MNPMYMCKITTSEIGAFKLIFQTERLEIIWQGKETHTRTETLEMHTQIHSTHFKYPVCQYLSPRVPAKMLICSFHSLHAIYCCLARLLACFVLRIFIKLNNIMCSHICNKIHFMSFLVQYNIHLIFSKWISLLLSSASLLPFIFFCFFSSLCFNVKKKVFVNLLYICWQWICTHKFHEFNGTAFLLTKSHFRNRKNENNISTYLQCEVYVQTLMMVYT